MNSTQLKLVISGKLSILSIETHLYVYTTLSFRSFILQIENFLENLNRKHEFLHLVNS